MSMGTISLTEAWKETKRSHSQGTGSMPSR
jgi:hypothetical protein